MAEAVDLSLAALAERYRSQQPSDVVEAVHARLEALQQQSPVFIALAPLATLKDACAAAERIPADARSALWGAFFAVKDNIDVADMPTTAACPAFSYTPTASAPTVQALVVQGAICVGKTNMDQFAAGLNGTRSPYGVPLNAVTPEVIPGGSSSGSASAVAAGCVTFALGTDTAGSGRVPAGLQGIVGIKPSVGLLSTRGVVPACASLDCVSVFARSVDDGWEVLQVMATAERDSTDHTLRRSLPPADAAQGAKRFRFGVPSAALLDFSGPRGGDYAEQCCAAFQAAATRLEGLGGRGVDLDFAPLCNVAKMLYETSFVAERYAGIRAFLESGQTATGPSLKDASSDDRLLPVTRAILAGAGKYSAADLYRDLEVLQKAKAACAAILDGVDLLLVPTVMHHYPVTELQAQEGADPPTWPFNAKLGTFTNFVNLLDLCGISIPAGTVAAGGLTLPFGVTILGRGNTDAAVSAVAKRFCA